MGMVDLRCLVREEGRGLRGEAQALDAIENRTLLAVVDGVVVVVEGAI